MRSDVRSLRASRISERDLATVLFHTCHLQEDQPALPELMSLPVAATIFKSCVAVTQSTTVGAGPSLVRQAYRLHWQVLTALYGSEDRIAAVATDLTTAGGWEIDLDLQQALDLISRYLTGWRPPDPLRDLDDQE